MSKKIQNDEKLCDNINRIIDHELNKADADMDLIKVYGKILDGREKGKYRPNSKRKKAELKKLSKAYKEFYIKQNPQKISVPTRKNRLHKIGTVLCSIILLTAMSLLTISALNDLSPAEMLAKFGKEILSWEIGKPVESNGMTFRRLGEATTYESLEDLVESENLDIYFPTWLPEDIYIESVYFFNSDGVDNIIIKFNTERLLFKITPNTPEGIAYKENYNKIEVNNFIVYYIEFENTYYASIEIDKYLYSITTSDMDILKNFVSGLIHK